MPAQETRAEVVVVGAGPVGLMLAGELRLGGADVLVVERLVEPTGESRATHLHARTVEVLDQRGLVEPLGVRDSDDASHYGGMPLGLRGLPSPFPGHWRMPQARTEAVLAEWATGLGARILRGHRVDCLDQDEHGVRAVARGPAGTVRLRARYLVGCDGENSTVRALAGFSFPGRPADRELLRADVRGIDVPDRRLRRGDGGLTSAAKRGGGVTRLMLHEFGRTVTPRRQPPGFAEIAAAWARITGEDISGATPLWTDVFDNTSRMVSRYRHGRILLAGDAAHRQMPVGGQALNIGLQEAVNLGWKLAAQVRGRAPAGLLDTYHEERHPVAARILTHVRAQAQLLLGGAESDPLRQVLGELLGFEEIREHLTALVSGLDIRYRLGAGDHPLLGARLPHRELRTAAGPTTTTALLRPARGVLLDLSGDAARTARLRAALAGRTDSVEVVTARPAGEGIGADAVLVRPDGHIAWLDGDGPDLHTAVPRWFG